MPLAASDRRQTFLLALCAVTALLVGVALWMALNAYGDTGVHWAPSTPYVERVESVDSGSPAQSAGIKAGDLLDTRALTPAQRLRFVGGERSGRSITLEIRRGGELHSVTLTPWNETKSAFWRADGWDQVLSIVGELWQIFVAAFLLWRRPKNVEVQLLALVLVVTQFGVAISPGLNNWITPWPALDAVTYALSFPIVYGGAALLATYALQFGRPISRLRRITTAATYAVVALTALGGVLGVAGSWFGFIDWPTWFVNQPATALTLALGTTLLPLACAGLALHRAHSSERARLAWVVGSLAINSLGSLAFTFTSTWGVWTHFGALFVDISVFLTPLGLTYALLSRRLLDVGFAVNRAAAYTVISLLVVGSFSLVEWALGGWLQSASKTTNLLFSAGLALVLGLSIHPIQRWVDRFVDGVFFRERQENERALRRFAREAAYMTDARAITERARAEILAHTDCTFCDLLLENESGGYGTVDENDRALVSLRATGAPIDLHDVATALRGERAYPLLARGRLLGTLIVGPKRTGESYAPDESAAIAELAHGVGIALDLLGGGHAAIPRLIDAVTALERCVHDLPDALAARLEDRKSAPPEWEMEL